MKATLVASVSATATFLVAGSALAQAQAQAQASTGGQAQASMALPGQADAVAGASDHDQVVGRLAVGYMGRRTLQAGAQQGATALDPVASVEAPVVGIRYWINPLLGIDAGLGFVVGGGSWDINAPGGAGADGDLTGAAAFLLHIGIPLSLTSAQHFSFQIVPEANVGYASLTTEGPTNGNDIKDTGLHFDLGARAGAEIHFGFMGIPQLSLQGSIGVRLDYESLKTEDEDTYDPDTLEQTISMWQLTTDTYDNPWNIFVSNVAALYYF